MTPPETTAIALELEKLRGTMVEGFAQLNGRLDGALQRTGVAEEDIRVLEARVTALERRVWTAAGAAAAIATIVGWVLSAASR